MQPNLKHTAEDAPEIHIETKLYDGSVTIQRGDFGRQKHAYRWVEKDLFIPGATSILGILDKPALIQWAANKTAEHVKANLKEGADKAEIERVCGEATKYHVRLKESAGEIGSNVHELAHKLFSGQPILVPEDEPTKNGLTGIMQWLKENDVQPIDIERVAFSKSAFFAGTFDLLAALNGKLALIDLKTSSFVYKEHKLQLGGYKFAWEEEFPKDRIEQLCILHLNKQTGKMKPHIYDDPDEMQFFTNTFLRVKQAADFFKQMRDY